MNTIEVLRAARELIKDPERRTTRAAAKNSMGQVVLAYDEDAVCWCAWGAVRKIEGGPSSLGPSPAMMALACAMGWNSETPNLSPLQVIYDFNDTRCHEDVMAAFDMAASVVEGLP